MSAHEEQVSPEEKLLNVIQGKGKGKADNEPAPEEKLLSAVKGKTVETDSRPESLESRDLPSIPKEPEVAQASKEADAAEQEEPLRQTPLIGTSPPVIFPKKQSARKFDIAVANRCLAAVALIMLCFTAFEIWANIRTVEEDRRLVGRIERTEDSGDDEGDGSKEHGQVVPIAKVLKMFENRPLLDWPKKQEKKQESKTELQSSTSVYARENLKLIGVSRTPGGEPEAIIMDEKKNKTYFLTAGQKISAGDQQLELQRIENDRAVFIHGNEKKTITVM